MKEKCSQGGCDRPVKAHELCQMHYDRHRSRHGRRREDRVLPTRARNRATAALDHTLPSSELDAMRAQLARNSGTTPGHSADVRTSATESDRISGNECPVERASDLSGNRA